MNEFSFISGLFGCLRCHSPRKQTSHLFRALIQYPPDLPITSRREDILAAIRGHQVVILAGETGSGKSIILAATQLILGERADLQVIAPGAKKEIVEAVFEISDAHLPCFEE